MNTSSQSAGKETLVEINTAHWHAELAPKRGGQLLRLRHRPTEWDVLHFPSDSDALSKQPEIWGIPVLFPPNRIEDGRFHWNGREYAFPLNEPERNNHLHGIVLRAPWEIETFDQAQIKLTFSHDSTHPTFSGYPHTFQIAISYLFHEDRVTQKIRLTNLSDDPMPFGLGFHTAFRLLPGQRCRLRLTAEPSVWQIEPKRRLPAGISVAWTSTPYDLIDGAWIDDRALSLHCPVATESIGSNSFRGAILDFPDESIRLRYEIGEDFRHWCLWKPADQKEFFCIEPMTWMINAPNLNLPPHITGFRYLDPCAIWDSQTTIQLSRLSASSK